MRKGESEGLDRKGNLISRRDAACRVSDGGGDGASPGKPRLYRGIMRVIAGHYRRRTLRSLPGRAIRPTADRLRETLFNVLSAGDPAALAESVWLDLYAGTGAVGIEALSRGARVVHFVESSKAAAELIAVNLKSLGIAQGFRF